MFPGDIQMSGKKRFFANHAKSSAAIISLAIHAVLIVVALSFVAVTVIKKEDQKFEAKPVNRPRMAMKKLQVPVKMNKKKPKPKLRKQITVKTKLDRKMPDIKMPEIAGMKGGLGSGDGGSLGRAGGIGFTMPEINIFGIKSRGEKVYLILDSSAEMMYDEMGGIPAYKIIKDELVRIVEGLGSTTIFNVCVFDGGEKYFLFPSMSPATAENAAKVKAWLAPLNAVKTGMGATDYGIKTLGPGGVKVDEDLRVGSFLNNSREPSWWYQPAMLAMSQKADTVFLLTNKWPALGYTPTDAEGVDAEAWKQTPDGKKWEESHKKGLKMLDEENKKRAERGDPPKVLGRGAWAINKEYFPGLKGPPSSKWVGYTPEDFQQAFLELRAGDKGAAALPGKSGISSNKQKRTKDEFSVNVIQFTKQGEQVDEKTVEKYKTLTQKCGGEYKTIAGMEAIKSYVTASE
jgi:hypothetical protein